MTYLGNRLRSSYHLPNAKAGPAMSEGHWQLEGSAAELFQRYLVPAITLKWAEDLVRRAQLRTGELGACPSSDGIFATNLIPFEA